MKKIIYGLLATISGLVLLFSYRTSLGESDPTATPPSVAPSASTSGGSGTGVTPPGSGGSITTALHDGTYTGETVDTRYGPIQVAVTITGGRITAVDVPTYPNGNPRDAQINQTAIPALVSETLSAQSAQIDMVSGATYTSEGYLQSAQSAIDQASA